MTGPSSITVAAARFPDDRAVVCQLFEEYFAGLEVDLAFQDVHEELADLPGKYAPPAGAILIARDHRQTALGCAALRPLAAPQTGEMKRLYVLPQARGQDLGRMLAGAIVERARAAGYRRIVLDTLAGMTAAQRLYAAMGFSEIPPYYDNPLPGTRYLSLDL